MSYSAPKATREPFDIEYKEIRRTTKEYFEMFLSDYFSANVPGVTLQSIRMILAFATDGAGIPSNEFNIYMEYSEAELIFTPDSNPALIPSEEEALMLLQMGITPNYIVSVVRPFTTTPFASTTKAALFPIDCEALP